MVLVNQTFYTRVTAEVLAYSLWQAANSSVFGSFFTVPRGMPLSLSLSLSLPPSLPDNFSVGMTGMLAPPLPSSPPVLGSGSTTTTTIIEWGSSQLPALPFSPIFYQVWYNLTRFNGSMENGSQTVNISDHTCIYMYCIAGNFHVGFIFEYFVGRSGATKKTAKASARVDI